MNKSPLEPLFAAPPASPPSKMRARPCPHPLNSKPIVSHKNWETFINSWDTLCDAEALKGLLHKGFDIPFSDGEHPSYTERILFYLNIADGWKDSKNFISAIGNCPEDVRRIAEKAFQVLCDKIFADGKKDQRLSPGWMVKILHPDVLERIMWFFRIDPDGRISNMTKHGRFDAHREEVLTKFLRELCFLAWNYNSHMPSLVYSKGDSVWQRLKALRPRLLPIMDRLGMLGVFLDGKTETDDTFIEAWKVYVLTRPVNFPPKFGGTRLPSNCEEACCGGNHAAITLLAVLKMREQEALLESKYYAPATVAQAINGSKK